MLSGRNERNGSSFVEYLFSVGGFSVVPVIPLEFGKLSVDLRPSNHLNWFHKYIQ